MIQVFSWYDHGQLNIKMPKNKYGIFPLMCIALQMTTFPGNKL